MGPRGLTTVPRDSSDPKIAYTAALNELLGNIRAGQVPHACDVRFGAAIVRALAEAEAQISKRG